MIELTNIQKYIGSKRLYSDLGLFIEPSKKVALIGRNGTGKTTLFNIINGKDRDFSGKIKIKNSLRIIDTKQEHYEFSDSIVIDYITKDVPKYLETKQVINNYENFPTSEMEDIQKYSDALEEFNNSNFSTLEDRVVDTLSSFGLDIEKSLMNLGSLSGGEKRFVELTRVIYSNADLILIDEPTNHMDYIGKEKFLEWFKSYSNSIVVISHDRDVLELVDQVIELKQSGTAVTYPGNYKNYLNQNSLSTIESIGVYENDLKRIERLKAQILQAKETFGTSKAGTIVINRFKRELSELEDNLKKPDFWIDQNSLQMIPTKLSESYNKYKSKNINLSNKTSVETRQAFSDLVKVVDFTFGYNGSILFEGLNFNVGPDDRIEIKGRNGAGKSTFLKNIISKFSTDKYTDSYISGEILLHKNTKIGVYDQEISNEFLDMTLEEFITKIYNDLNIVINQQIISGLLSKYLFDPIEDKGLKMRNASGGQKSRVQIIKMFANNPNLLILDEPTNHLDLPSIEELENALNQYKGAIIYVSHDTYFKQSMGGKIISIQK